MNRACTSRTFCASTKAARKSRIQTRWLSANSSPSSSSSSSTSTSTTPLDPYNAFNYQNNITQNNQHPHGPLSSWSISIKDNFCTKDMPTTASSKMLSSFNSPFDAVAVSILRKSGASLVGKTNCDEFGMG